MAKYNSRKNNTRKSAKIINKNQSEVSDETPLFDDKQVESNEEIYKEIKEVLADGIYDDVKDNETNHLEDEESKIFDTNIVDLADKEGKSQKVDKKQKSDDLLAKKAKKEAKKAAYKKTTLKHKIKVMAVLMVLAVFSGSGLGVWYFNFALKSNVDYSGNPNDYIQSIDDTLTRNFSGINLIDKENWLSYINGKTPADLNAADNLVLALYNASIADSYISVGEGNIVTGITKDQYMYSERKFDGNTYSFVSISPTTNTFVGDVAVCDILEKGSATIKSYEGPILEGNKSADWKYVASYTTDKYSEMTGVAVNDVQAYIVGEKTIVSANEIKTDENGNYVITVKLDTVNSVLKYIRQVKRTGGLDSYPEFLNIEQTYTITPDWQLVSLYTKETYKALKMVARPTINAEMTTYFTFNEPVTLPVELFAE